jgi:small subunit ribosomal protein S21
MLNIKVSDFKSLEQALKVYKRKFEKTKTVKELRSRQEFVKPSVKRRSEVNKAKYIQKTYRNNDID